MTNSKYDDMVDALAYAILSTKPKQPNKLQRFGYWLAIKAANITKFVLRRVRL